MRLAGVAAAADDPDRHRVGRRHDRPAPTAHPTARQRGGDVQGERGIDRRPVPSERAGTSSRPSSSMNRAPWWPSSPGWNMKSTRPAISSRRSLNSCAAPTASPCACRGRRRACTLDVRGEVEPGVLRHRQGVHVAAQQHRRARLRPLEQRDDAARRLVGRDRQRQPLERLQHAITGDRQFVAELGPLVQRAPQRDRVAEQVLRVRPHRPDHRVDVVSASFACSVIDAWYVFPSVAVTAHCCVERRHRVGARPTPRQAMETIMTMYGANPEQLTNLGTTLNRQIDTISQVMSTVDGVLNGTHGPGPPATGSSRTGTAVSSRRSASSTRRSGWRAGLHRDVRRAPPGARRSRLIAGASTLAGWDTSSSPSSRSSRDDPARTSPRRSPRPRRADSRSTSGPFGSSVVVDLAEVGDVIAALTDAAMANGATHVSVHVAREMPTGPPAFEVPRGGDQ